MLPTSVRVRFDTAATLWVKALDMHAVAPATRSIVWAVLALVVASGRLGAQNPIQDHPGQYDRADIENGSRLYGTQCSQCHGPNGDALAGVDLRRGQFRRAASDDELAQAIATGVPGSGMPPFATLQPSEVTGLIAFIRAGFDVTSIVRIGRLAPGQALFEGKAGCAACHRINGRGPRLATDLSDIGAIRTPAALQRSLLDPAGSLLPASRTVGAVTRDGKAFRGRRLNEDTYTVQLFDEQERLVSLVKADLRSYEISTASAMPSYKDRLTADELSDVIAYLLSLKGL